MAKMPKPGCALFLLALAIAAAPVRAEDMTAKDVQIAVKAIGFLDPAPAGDALVAVVFAAGDVTGRRSAETIASYFGAGLKVHDATLRAKVVDAATLSGGQGFIAIIAMNALTGAAAMPVARSQHIPCITGDMSAVQAGDCTVGISTAGKVDIVLNRANAALSGLGFAAAFRMLIREI